MGMRVRGGVAAPARPNRGTGGQRGGRPREEETTAKPKWGARRLGEGTLGTRTTTTEERRYGTEFLEGAGIGMECSHREQIPRRRRRGQQTRGQTLRSEG